MRIPVYQPSLSGNEKKYVNECLDSTWISSRGKFVSAFESEFARYTDVKYASGVCNGTVALHLALVALGIGPGDEVIVPTFTYIASVNAITYTGATPVFVDSVPATWQLDPADVKRKLTPKTRAIMAVHLYGHPCDMEPLVALAREHDLFLVEDCAEAFGGKYQGRHVGTFGDIGAYSFFGNKTITTGEGGMVVTNDEALYEKVIHYKGQGQVKDRQYWYDVVGYNYRMTNICAALGLAQLEQADRLLANKRAIAGWYREGLKKTPVALHDETPGVVHSFWMVSILTPDPSQRDALQEHLANEGVETRPAFYPVHTMPMYVGSEQYPVAENLGARGINLPSGPDLTREQVNYICEAIAAFFA